FYQTTRNLLTEHVVVGGGLPAMQPTRYVRKIASSFIAGKPPPTVGCLLRDSATSKTWWGLPQKRVSSVNHALSEGRL
ncbi:hypothetical protein, partial [Pseudomonas viridiflava]|uniref:hypothetical protein n=1 Tax=Pseudomonas viridiflava TaxID=33069 RepID=UPI001C109D66